VRQRRLRRVRVPDQARPFEVLGRVRPLRREVHQGAAGAGRQLINIKFSFRRVHEAHRDPWLLLVHEAAPTPWGEVQRLRDDLPWHHFLRTGVGKDADKAWQGVLSDQDCQCD
jgi:hypothetical protein